MKTGFPDFTFSTICVISAPIAELSIFGGNICENFPNKYFFVYPLFSLYWESISLYFTTMALCLGCKLVILFNKILNRLFQTERPPFPLPCSKLFILTYVSILSDTFSVTYLLNSFINGSLFVSKLFIMFNNSVDFLEPLKVNSCGALNASLIFSI